MRGFVERLAEVNRLADVAPGFVWRLQTDAGDATGIRAFEDERILFNHSLWESAEALRDFVYSGAHLEAFRGRHAWFEPLDRRSQVMWWLPVGVRPDAAEGRRRLERLWSDGPSGQAFDFSGLFPPPA
jgi:heme-degrading monooxygenase HmoA